MFFKSFIDARFTVNAVQNKLEISRKHLLFQYAEMKIGKKFNQFMGMVSLGYRIKTSVIFLNIHCFHVSLCCIFLSAFVPEANISVQELNLIDNKIMQNILLAYKGQKGIKISKCEILSSSFDNVEI